MLTHAVEKLTQFAVIVAEGSDAQTFLQGQLTNSLQALGPETHQRTGYCSAKGRLLAILQAWQVSPDSYALLLPAEIAAPVCKRLSMYVLRAKVRLSVVPAEISGHWGLADPLADGVLQRVGANDFWLGMASCPDHGARALRVRLDGSLVDGESDQPTTPYSTGDARPQADRPGVSRWPLADIRSGTPWIWTATQDLFVPQMVNLELLAGVDFKKGCYPGQEVVARSQYLGKLNRRMFGLEWETSTDATPPGGAVWNPTDPDQPCGSLVSVAENPKNSRRYGLVSVMLEGWAEAGVHGLHIGSAGGPKALPFALPYAVPTSPQIPNRPKL